MCSTWVNCFVNCKLDSSLNPMCQEFISKPTAFATSKANECNSLALARNMKAIL